MGDPAEGLPGPDFFSVNRRAFDNYPYFVYFEKIYHYAACWVTLNTLAQSLIIPLEHKRLKVS